MHKLDMMHGDIRPENVFLKSNGKPMLTGFGLTKVTQFILAG
jgi:serine/threonine protein kinase